jgi:hypothetical protein
MSISVNVSKLGIVLANIKSYFEEIQKIEVDYPKAEQKKKLLVKIDLSNCNLYEIPNDIFLIADIVELLNLGGNHISSLPLSMINFRKLKILFFANNNFETIPIVLGSLPSLYMLSFKSNKISNIPCDSLSSSIGWLILTDNLITTLPSSIGRLIQLRKCMLAGNLITELPEEMENCVNLELLRLSSNKLKVFPKILLELPKLSWFACAGNTFNNINNNVSNNDNVFNINSSFDLPLISWKKLEIIDKLGEGASGIVYKAIYKTNRYSSKLVALKLFKGRATSDGLPEDEMNISVSIGYHENSVKVLGKLIENPDNQLGLILSLIPDEFKILGEPPSFDTCTRDVYPVDKKLSLCYVFKIIKGVSSICSHLHSKGISHGDLYAHNILVNENNGRSLLTDFGAASMYEVNSSYGLSLQLYEIRSFGCLLEELILLINNKEIEDNVEIINKLKELSQDCFQHDIFKRPTFDIIFRKLSSY